MQFRHIARLSILAVAGMLTATTGGAATTIAVKPRADRGYPNRSGGYEQAYATAKVTVHARPSAGSRIVNRLSRGDFVNVGECQRTWCYVDVHGGSGWLAGRFIGRGTNPYHNLGPAGPGIPPQEPGTYDRNPTRRY